VAGPIEDWRDALASHHVPELSQTEQTTIILTALLGPPRKVGAALFLTERSVRERVRFLSYRICAFADGTADARPLSFWAGVHERCCLADGWNWIRVQKWEDRLPKSHPNSRNPSGTDVVASVHTAQSEES
jgi:hypothetical protein